MSTSINSDSGQDKSLRMLQILRMLPIDRTSHVPYSELLGLLETPSIGVIPLEVLENNLEYLLSKEVSDDADEISVRLNLFERWLCSKKWDAQSFWPQLQWCFGNLEADDVGPIYALLGQHVGPFVEENLEELANSFYAQEGPLTDIFPFQFWGSFRPSIVQSFRKAGRGTREDFTSFILAIENAAPDVTLLASFIADKKLPLRSRLRFLDIWLENGYKGCAVLSEPWLNHVVDKDRQRLFFAYKGAAFGSQECLAYLKRVNKPIAEIIATGLVVENKPEEILHAVRMRTWEKPLVTLPSDFAGP